MFFLYLTGHCCLRTLPILPTRHKQFSPSRKHRSQTRLHRQSTVVTSNTGVGTHCKTLPLLGDFLPTLVTFMSNPAHSTFATSDSARRDGMDTAVSIAVPSALGERRSLNDLRGPPRALSMKSSVDRKDGSLGRSSLRRSILARTAPRSKTSGTPIAPLDETVRPSSVSGGSDELFVRRAATDEKPGHTLQLPSFETLGIAAPHPDNFCTQPHLSTPTDQPRTYPGSEGTAGLGLHNTTGLANKEYRRPNQVVLQMLTPPDDSGTIDWRSSSTTVINPTRIAAGTTLRNMQTQQSAPVVTATNPGSSDADPPSGEREPNCGDKGMADGSEPPLDHIEGVDEADSTDQSLIEQAVSITG